MLKLKLFNSKFDNILSIPNRPINPLIPIYGVKDKSEHTIDLDNSFLVINFIDDKLRLFLFSTKGSFQESILLDKSSNLYQLLETKAPEIINDLLPIKVMNKQFLFGLYLKGFYISDSERGKFNNINGFSPQEKQRYLTINTKREIQKHPLVCFNITDNCSYQIPVYDTFLFAPEKTIDILREIWELNTQCTYTTNHLENVAFDLVDLVRNNQPSKYFNLEPLTKHLKKPSEDTNNLNKINSINQKSGNQQSSNEIDPQLYSNLITLFGNNLEVIRALQENLQNT